MYLGDIHGKPFGHRDIADKSRKKWRSIFKMADILNGKCASLDFIWGERERGMSVIATSTTGCSAMQF
jgi:hypothetical protein